MSASMLAATLVLEREGLRVAGAIVALLVLPALLVCAAAAALAATALGGLAGGASQLAAVPVDQAAVMTATARASGVPWSLLAAVASVESDFGRNMATSSAGAIGYGQFLPEIWTAFGAGDPYDFRDAIPAMARYLAAAGAATDPARAVYAYNHSWSYVATVLARAAVYATLGPAGGSGVTSPAVPS